MLRIFGNRNWLALNPHYFITGIGTGIGKTVVAAILAEALGARYWKPIQAGYDEGTDTGWVRSVLTHGQDRVVPEVYRLQKPASPHISAREEGLRISLSQIKDVYQSLEDSSKPLIIEGAGGLMVPLNETDMVADLIRELGCQVILVSRNYLGSINHSLLTAQVCKDKGLPVAGWVFNDRFMDYESEIETWSGYPSLGSVPPLMNNNAETIRQIANGWKEELMTKLKQ